MFCSSEDSYRIKALSNVTCNNTQDFSEFGQRNSTATTCKNTTLKFLPGKHNTLLTQ